MKKKPLLTLLGCISAVGSSLLGQGIPEARAALVAADFETAKAILAGQSPESARGSVAFELSRRRRMG